MHAHSIAFPEVALPAVVRVSACQIARSEVQMKTEDEFLNFHFIRNWSPSVFKRERFFSIRSKLSISLVDLKNVRDGEMIAQEDKHLCKGSFRCDRLKRKKVEHLRGSFVWFGKFPFHPRVLFAFQPVQLENFGLVESDPLR